MYAIKKQNNSNKCNSPVFYFINAIFSNEKNLYDISPSVCIRLWLNEGAVDGTIKVLSVHTYFCLASDAIFNSKALAQPHKNMNFLISKCICVCIYVCVCAWKRLCTHCGATHLCMSKVLNLLTICWTVTVAICLATYSQWARDKHAETYVSRSVYLNTYRWELCPLGFSLFIAAQSNYEWNIILKLTMTTLSERVNKWKFLWKIKLNIKNLGVEYTLRILIRHWK